MLRSTHITHRDRDHNKDSSTAPTTTASIANQPNPENTTPGPIYHGDNFNGPVSGIVGGRDNKNSDVKINNVPQPQSSKEAAGVKVEGKERYAKEARILELMAELKILGHELNNSPQADEREKGLKNIY